MTKSELRKIYLAKRQDLLPYERAEKSQQITDRFFRSFDLSRIKVLHCFISIEKFNEIDTTLIFQWLWREFPDVTTVVPRVNSKPGEIENLAFTVGTELVENEWGIYEPVIGEHLDAANIDIVLVPLLCFDERGFRVGYGKGFYDKLLTKCRQDCLKIGLSYFPPTADIDDIGKQDVRLDCLVTPEEIFTFRN